MTIDLGKSDLPIKADMTASVHIIVAERVDVLLVLARAVRRDSQGKYVEIPEGSGLKRVSVQVGLSDEAYIEILNGLEEGEEVVVTRPRTNIFEIPGR